MSYISKDREGEEGEKGRREKAMAGSYLVWRYKVDLAPL